MHNALPLGMGGTDLGFDLFFPIYIVTSKKTEKGVGNVRLNIHDDEK